MKYVGLPLGASLSHSPSRTRCWKKWSKNWWDGRGCICTLSKLPTYFLSLFQIPCKVTYWLEKLQRITYVGNRWRIQFSFGELGYGLHPNMWKRVWNSELAGFQLGSIRLVDEEIPQWKGALKRVIIDLEFIRTLRISQNICE